MASWDDDDETASSKPVWKAVPNDASRFAGEDEDEPVAEDWEKAVEEGEEAPKAPAKKAPAKETPKTDVKPKAKEEPKPVKPKEEPKPAAKSSWKVDSKPGDRVASKLRDQQAIEESDAALLRDQFSESKPAKKIEAKKPVVDDDEEEEEEEEVAPPPKSSSSSSKLPSGPKKDDKVKVVPQNVKSMVDKIVVAADPKKTHENVMSLLKAVSDKMTSDQVKKIRDELTGVMNSKVTAEKSKKKGGNKPMARVGARDEYDDYGDDGADYDYD